MNAFASAAPTREPAPSAPRARAVVLTLAAVVGAWFVVTYAAPYVAQGSDGAYAGLRPWLLLHLACGTVALLVGPVQLWLGLGRRSLALHRRLGILYVASVAVGTAAAFTLLLQTRLGWVFATGIAGLAIAWVVTTGLGVVSIRHGLLAQHREWMIRSYVVTFAFVTFRLLFRILHAAGVGTLAEQLGAASWFCWAAPLLLTEAVLQGRKIFQHRAEEPAAA